MQPSGIFFPPSAVRQRAVSSVCSERETVAGGQAGGTQEFEQVSGEGDR